MSQTVESLSNLLMNITENEGENLLADDISTITSTLERNFTIPNDKVHHHAGMHSLISYLHVSVHVWLG